MCDFEVSTLSVTKIASSCCDKNRLCKQALKEIKGSFTNAFTNCCRNCFDIFLFFLCMLTAKSFKVLMLKYCIFTATKNNTFESCAIFSVCYAASLDSNQ